MNAILISTIAELVIKFGVPAAEAIYNLIADAIENKGAPTPEMWAALRARVKTADELKAEALAKFNR
jgi:hypothetical protein